MRYKNLCVKEEIPLDNWEITKRNIAMQRDLSNRLVYMAEEKDINWIKEQTIKDNIIREDVVILNPVNNITFVFNSKIYTGHWNKRKAKNGTTLYVFCTSDRVNKDESRVIFIGFKRVYKNTEPGYSELEFIVNETCPLYKEIKRKVRI